MSKVLKDAASYSKSRIALSDISIENYVTTDNLLQNKSGKTDAVKLPKQTSDSVTQFNDCDILIGNIRPYLKKIWFARYRGGSSTDVLTLKVNKLNHPEFIYYSLFRDEFFEHMMNGSKGTKMPRGDKDQVLEFPVPDFDLNIQKQIAKVLSDLDAKIEVNNKINQQLESMAKTLYDYWFVQFDFPDKNGKPYKSAGGKMVYNEELKREIPDGWEDGTFGDYSNAKGGYAFKSAWWIEDGLPVIKIKDIDENYSIDLANCSYVGIDKLERCKDFQANPGDVLLAMTGATVGKFGIVPKSDIPILVNQRVAHYRLGKEPIRKLPYLINSLSQDYFRETIFIVASGAAQPNISSDQLDAIPLVRPKAEVIDTFNDRLSTSYEKILNNKSENQILTELRDWLLPMLMNGQVTVNSHEAGVENEGLGMVAQGDSKYGKK